jgi:hypothetical protein
VDSSISLNDMAVTAMTADEGRQQVGYTGLGWAVKREDVLSLIYSATVVGAGAQPADGSTRVA